MASSYSFNFLTRRVVQASLSTMLAAGLAFSQDSGATPVAGDTSQQTTNGGGWPRAGDPGRNAQTPPNNSGTGPSYGNDANSGYGPAPNGGSGQNPNDNYGYGRAQGNQPPSGPMSNDPVPSQLTIKPGTFVTVRVNQTLSSDRSQAGDAFSATLVRPIVVDGVVVAQRGQTLGGRVSEAQKAGRVEGTSRLAIQLTDLTLVDGQQMPIQSQFISRNGSTSVGRDAGAVAGTTALGAAVGAAADWGRGAAIGAGAGAAAGIVGVLLTRGRPTVIYPESVLTFRIEAPVVIATDRSRQAFRYVDPADYDQPSDHQPSLYASQASPLACAGYGCAPPPSYYYGPSYYPYSYWGPSWGPSLYFYGGPRYYYGPRFYGGFRGGYYRGGGFHRR